MDNIFNDIITLEAEDEGKRIDLWISEQIEDYSRSYIRKLIDDKNVKVNKKSVKANYKIRTRDLVEVFIPEPELLDAEPENIPLDVVYEDEHLIVINKPKGMVVHPAPGNSRGTLVNALMYHCKGSLSNINGVVRPGIVHRIDKDTTGLLVAAKNNKAHEVLADMLKRHDINRIYEAIAEGVISPESGTIDAPIGRHKTDRKKMDVDTKNGRHAITHFTVLERFKGHTYVRFQLETGRTHQIRVHMAYIGHPLLGDPVYGYKNRNFDTVGQVLHARYLRFRHPITGEFMELEASLPKYFSEILEALK